MTYNATRTSAIYMLRQHPRITRSAVLELLHGYHVSMWMLAKAIRCLKREKRVTVVRKTRAGELLEVSK